MKTDKFTYRDFEKLVEQVDHIDWDVAKVKEYGDYLILNSVKNGIVEEDKKNLLIWIGYSKDNIEELLRQLNLIEYKLKE